MNLSSIICAFTAAFLCTSCATRRLTVPLGYSTVTNKVAQWRPSKISKHPPRLETVREEMPGEIYKIWYLEDGGDPKFGPYTFVQVRREDKTTKVELSTTKAV